MITLQLQKGAYYPYEDEDVAWTEKQKDNALFVVSFKTATKMELRSLAQNRMQFKWYGDLAKQGDMTAQEYRSMCKLEFGVPILRMEDEQFREIYDRLIRPLDYEDKIALMTEPIDFPITSQMSVEQMIQYLFNMSTHFIKEGFSLTKLEFIEEWMAEDEERRSK